MVGEEEAAIGARPTHYCTTLPTVMLWEGERERERERQTERERERGERRVREV